MFMVAINTVLGVAIAVGIVVSVSVALYKAGYRFISGFVFLALVLALPILFLLTSGVVSYATMFIGSLFEGSLFREMYRAFTQTYQSSGTPHGAPIWWLPAIALFTIAIEAAIALLLRRWGVHRVLIAILCVLLIPFLAFFGLWLPLLMLPVMALFGGNGAF